MVSSIWEQLWLGGYGISPWQPLIIPLKPVRVSDVIMKGIRPRLLQDWWVHSAFRRECTMLKDLWVVAFPCWKLFLLTVSSCAMNLDTIHVWGTKVSRPVINRFFNVTHYATTGKLPKFLCFCLTLWYILFYYFSQFWLTSDVIVLPSVVFLCEIDRRGWCSWYAAICTIFDLFKHFLSGICPRNNTESTLPWWQVCSGESCRPESVVTVSKGFSSWSRHHWSHSRSKCKLWLGYTQWRTWWCGVAARYGT